MLLKWWTSSLTSGRNGSLPSCGEAKDVFGNLGGNLRPVDLLIAHWKGSGPLAVDVTVVHPLTPSTHFHSVKTGVEVLVQAELMKESKNSACLRIEQHRLQAFCALHLRQAWP